MRQARHETQIARDALEAETQPIFTDVPRGLFTEEIDWHNADGTMTTKRVDRSELSVGTSGPEPISGVSVPVRNAGRGPAWLGEVTFTDSGGRTAAGWVTHPFLPPGEMTRVGLSAGPNDADVAVAESIAMGYDDFAVVIAYADARNRARGTVRLKVVNGENPRVIDRDWDAHSS